MAVRKIRVKVGERSYNVELEDVSTSPVRVTVDGETFFVEVEGLPAIRPKARRLSGLRPPPPATSQAGVPAPRISEKLIRAPMPGRVVAVNVRPGDNVQPGDEVCVLESMKMEQSIRAAQAGVIKAVHIHPLQQVNADDPLVELE